jgi:ABC-type glycerol-3-phosphate transport system substrate-binding protein
MSHLNRYLLALIMLALMLPSAHTSAQNPIVLVAHIPTQFNPIPADAIANFESQFGVELVFHEDDTRPYLPSPADNSASHLDALRDYAQSADVLLVRSETLNVIGTNSGYFLDLAPLVNADSQMNINAYHQAAWQSFQWDGSLWALPISFDTIQIGYNPSAFDAIGLSYPSDSWTLADYAFAIESLTQRDSSGNVIQAGFENGYLDSYFLVAAANRSLANDNTFPSTPQLNDPSLIEALQNWQNLLANGSIAPKTSSMAGETQTMAVFQSSFFANSSAQAAPLPNGILGLSATAFAVSAGTSYPELAYELAKFLSNQASVQMNIGQSYPVQNSPIDSANIRPMSEMRYAAFLMQAMANPEAADLALANAQISAESALQLATERQATPILVNLPPTSAEGINLRFGVHTTIAPLPNQAQWDEAARTFAEADSEVGSITVEANFSASLEETTSNYDCFLLQQSNLSAVEPSLLLPISPLLAQDASFDPNDLVGDLWMQMQATGDIYGYPVTLMPRYLALDNQAFANAGLPMPASNWTIDEFNLALSELQRSTGQAAYTIDDSLSIMSLLAAYGVLPIDYLNGTTSFGETASVLTEILNLRNAGLLNYSGLSSTGMGTAPTSPIRPASITLDLPTNLDGFQLVNYPAGTNYAVASYRLGTIYISRNSANPHACYRWLRYLAQNPWIFQSMPTHHSQLSESFQSYATLLEQPNLVVIPWISPFGGDNKFVLQHFYNQALDAIFLNNADITSSLADAQAKADAYQHCRATGESEINCATPLIQSIETVWR